MTGDLLRSVSFDAWTAAAAGIMERIDRLAALEAEMIALGETINVSRFSLPRLRHRHHRGLELICPPHPTEH